MTYSVYFLPLAKAIGQGSWEAIEIVTGIYLKVVPDNGVSTKRVFRRVGYAEFTELEEPKTEYDKARHIEWKRLAQVSPPYKHSEEVLITYVNSNCAVTSREACATLPQEAYLN
jgi:hypothetical protein